MYARATTEDPHMWGCACRRVGFALSGWIKLAAAPREVAVSA